LVLFMVKIHYLVVIVNKGDTFVVGYIFVMSSCLERIDLPWSDKKARYVFFCQFRYKPSSLGLFPRNIKRPLWFMLSKRTNRTSQHNGLKRQKITKLPQ